MRIGMNIECNLFINDCFLLRLVFEQYMEQMNRKMPYMEVIVPLVLNGKFDSSFPIVSNRMKSRMNLLFFYRYCRTNSIGTISERLS